MPRKPRHLSDPAVMLETLKLAYRHQLDTLIPGAEDTRLTAAQRRELGRRLARYWLMPDPAAPLISEQELQEVVDQVTEAAQKAWAAVTSTATTVKQRVQKRT